MGLLAKFVLLASLILSLAHFIETFSLKLDKEILLARQCHHLEVWHTPDKMKVIYLAENESPLETPESRILMHPQNPDEIDLQTYFLEKEFPFIDLFLDDENFAEHGKFSVLPQHKWKRVLRHVVRWMAEYKFLEIDPRVFGQLAELPEDRFLQRVLYRQFPIPVLKDFHPIVQEACEKGLLYCLKLVHEYAVSHAQLFNKYLNSDHTLFLRHYATVRRKYHRHSADLSKLAMRNAKKDFCAVQGDLGYTWFSGQKYEPFLSRSDFFEFRATASYYLCNYTMTQRRLYESLAYPGWLEGYHEPARRGTDKFNALHCLYDYKETPGLHFAVYRRPNLAYTMATLGGFPCSSVGTCEIPIEGKMGRKRLDDEFFWDFSCVLTAFCPDVCCGAYKNPLQDPNDINRCTKADKDYPCRDGSETDRCDYDLNKNTNFFDLIQNRINVTCGCNNKEGKEWNSALAACLDVDECLAANPCNRDSEVCINRLNGSQPLCVCEFGYYRRNAIGDCVVDPDSGLFRNIDEVELRMRQLYGPVMEGTAPNYTLVGKDAEALAVKQALGNIGGAFKRKNIGIVLKFSLDNLALTLLLGIFYQPEL